VLPTVAPERTAPPLDVEGEEVATIHLHHIAKGTDRRLDPTSEEEVNVHTVAGLPRNAGEQTRCTLQHPTIRIVGEHPVEKPPIGELTPQFRNPKG